MLINFNHIKTFFNALVQKMKGFRGNWEQNDDTADDYIKNRTHWSEGFKEVETVLVNNLTADVYYDDNPYRCNFVPGQSYDVAWNGTLYKNVICRFVEGYNILGGINDYPFYIDDGGGYDLYVDSDDKNWTLSISAVEKKEVVHKLDKKFIDMPDGIVTENDLATVAKSGSYYDLNDYPETYADVVRYNYQGLLDSQKEQARTNINAAAADETYVKNDYLGSFKETKTYTWDGNTTGHLAFSLTRNNQTEYFYKISDDVFDWRNIASYTTKSTSSTSAWPGTEIISGSNWYKTYYSIVILDTNQCTIEGNTFTPPAPGIYFRRLASGWYQTELSLEICDPIQAGQAMVVKALDENGKPSRWEAADIPVVVQPDLSQNDPNAADYVKGRTHHMETSWHSVGWIAGATFQEKSDLGIRYTRCSQGLTPIENARYRMTINGTVLGPALYRVNDRFTDGYCLGNAYLYGLYTYGSGKTKEEIEAEGYVDTKEDFVYVNSSFVATTNPNVIAGKNVPVFTEMETVVVKPLDEKYIPNTIARKADIPQSDLSQSDPAAPDYVKNRTHYDDEIQIDTFVWDGNSEGRIVVPKGDSGIFYTKISDVMPTLDDCSKGGKVVRTYPDGRSVTATIKTSTTSINSNGWLVIANSLVVVPEELVGVYFENDDCTFPESGLYGIGSDGVSPRYEISITGFTGFNERVLKKLDPKYLPDSIPYEETVFGDTLIWDGNADGCAKVVEADYYKISDAIPTLEDVTKGGSVTRINTGDTVQEYAIKTETLLSFADGAFCYAQVVFSVSEEWAGVTIPGLNLTFPEAGTYVIGEIPYTITINGYSGFETTVVKKLDKKFLPVDVATKADIFGAMEASY